MDPTFDRSTVDLLREENERLRAFCEEVKRENVSVIAAGIAEPKRGDTYRRRALCLTEQARIYHTDREIFLQTALRSERRAAAAEAALAEARAAWWDLRATDQGAFPGTPYQRKIDRITAALTPAPGAERKE